MFCLPMRYSGDVFGTDMFECDGVIVRLKLDMPSLLIHILGNILV